MSTLSQIFQYNGYQVRTAGTAEDPWFVAQDVCSILDLSDVSMSMNRLDEDEKGTNSVCTPGGNQQMLCISESGLYSLVLTSRKPEAKAFKKWITSEVLPSIRKTGSYSAKPMTAAELIHAQSGLLLEHDRRLAQMEALQAQLNEKLESAQTQHQQLQAQLEETKTKLNDQEQLMCAHPESFRAMLDRRVKNYAYNTGNYYPAVWNFLYAQLETRYNVRVKKSPSKIAYVTGRLNLTKELYLIAKEYILPVNGQYRRDFLMNDSAA